MEIVLSENATYLVRNKETGTADGVLRVSRPGYHDLEELKSEMKWLKQINEYTPLIVANPIPALDGETVQQVEGSDGNIYFCVICEFLTGENPVLDNEEQLVTTFKFLGETTAYLHRQTEIWNGTKTLKRICWDFDTIIGKKSDYVAQVYTRPVDLSELIKRLQKEGEAVDKLKEFKSILIVDDDATALRSMKSLLSTHYKILVANSGMNAITILAKNKVDLILLDFEMPIVNGPKVLEMIRSDPNTANIPVMFLTAKGDKRSIMEVLRFKPEKYLLKTMLPKDILDSIDEYFKMKR